MLDLPPIRELTGPGPDAPPAAIQAAYNPRESPYYTAGACTESREDVRLFGVIPGLDALLASLRTCEVAAEATRAVGERFLTDAYAQGLLQLGAQGGQTTLSAAVEPNAYRANASETAVPHVGLRPGHLACMDRESSEGTSSLRTSLALLAESSFPGSEKACMERESSEGTSSLRTSIALLAESSLQRSKKDVREKMNENEQESGCTPLDLNLILTCLDARKRKTLEATPAPTASKKRRGNVNATGLDRRSLTSAAHSVEEALAVRRTTPAATSGAPVMRLPAHLPTEDALGGLRALSRQQGPVKQSRMSRRLECFRREAEEALKGQHNATVMSIFSTIDGHIRSFRGGSMSPSELDLRIMTVIDRCLPLEGDEARAVEAVLDMATVRRLKASLEGRPRNSGALLDLIALSKLCRQIPGVCFDKWNLGWIATWREHRRPVHKHFGAKKYGFFRAREFAICYRSKMTSDLTVEGTGPSNSPKSAIAREDFSSLLARSTKMLSQAILQQKIEQRTTTDSGGNSAIPTAELAKQEAAATRRSKRSFTSIDCETAREGSSTNSTAAEDEARTPQRRQASSSVAAARLAGASSAPAEGSEQQIRTSVAQNDPGTQLPVDPFVSRDGWADLVARTPRVERVSFDFTNQSWIAQWKQHGRTTYRRFAVSKYGFTMAHKLAVEYKSKYFKETLHPFASFLGIASSCVDSTAPAPEGGIAGGVEAAQAHPQEQEHQGAVTSHGSGPSRGRYLPRRQCEAIGSNCMLKAEGDRNCSKSELQGTAHMKKQQQQQQERKEIDRSCTRCIARPSTTRKRHQQHLDQQEEHILDGIARNSGVSTNEIGFLKVHAEKGNLRLAGEGGASSTLGPTGALEALLCSSLEIGKRIGFPATTESPAGARGIECTSTTATPTNHTHISVDSFPVNALSTSSQQHTATPGTGTPPADAGESQLQAAQQQELQRTVLHLLQLKNQVTQYEGGQQGTQQLQQNSPLVLASGAISSSMSQQVNQDEVALQGVEMLRTAIKCMLLDMASNCMQDINSSGGRRQVYSDLVYYHLNFVDEAQPLDSLRPYTQLFAPCLHGKILPSALPVAMKAEILSSLESLFMQHQQQLLHQKQLMHFFVTQAQQQRQLQEQQVAAAQHKLALLQVLLAQKKIEQAMLRIQIPTTALMKTATNLRQSTVSVASSAQETPQREVAGDDRTHELRVAESIVHDGIAADRKSMSRHPGGVCV